MDREILFRGKRIYDDKWIYGNLIIDEYGEKHIVESNVVIQDGHHLRIDSDLPVFFKQETIGQYTGLTDRDGVRIFEGDVCRVTRPCVLAYGKITFANACFWFVDDGPGGMLRLYDIKPNCFEIEVIGNIHDRKDGQND